MPRWKPGESGNRNGRPRHTVDFLSVRELARSHAPECIATLAAIMKDESCHPSARASAAESLLSRAFGKPETVAEVTIKPAPSSPQDVLREITELQRRLGLLPPPLLPYGEAKDSVCSD